MTDTAPDSKNASPDSGRVERPSNPAKRREHPRLVVEADITVHSEHNLYAGFVENVSASGVFVATHAPRKIGEKVEFSIKLGSEDNVVAGVGEVRWVREYSDTSDAPPGMGVRFLELEEASRKRLEEFIRSREPLFFDDD
jgi:uncharacterized protein (TIGR02266 family)